MCRMIQEDKSSEAVVADENAKTEKISEKGMVIRMQQNADLNVNTLTNTTYREDDKVVGTRSAKSSPTRRVGTVTFGITLVCYGILFLVHIFVPMVRYSFIFRCWPIVFILLGGEILVESHKCKTGEWKMIYDFPAVIMLGIMLLFAMIMAAIDFEMAYEMHYGQMYFW